MTVFVLICQDFTSRLPSFWVNLARERRQREREKLRRDEKKIIKDFEDNTAGIICNILSARVNHGGFNVEEKNTYRPALFLITRASMRPSLDLFLSTVIPLQPLSQPSAVQFISPQISLSFPFLLYIYMCVLFQKTTHHYFPRGKKRE